MTTATAFFTLLKNGAEVAGSTFTVEREAAEAVATLATQDPGSTYDYRTDYSIVVTEGL